MKFENIIKNVSAIVAALIVFFMSATMYFSAKGFEMTPDGEIVLMNQAQAESAVPAATPVIPNNYVMPKGHSIGSQKAPVVLYEYSSMGCFHCADFHLKTLPELEKKYVNDGKLRVVFVSFPIDKPSMNATLLAECVPADKYFDFIKLLFKKQREWGMSRNPDKLLLQYAALNGVSAEKAQACLKNDAVATDILEYRQDAVTQLGIRGTPSFVISHNGKSRLIDGAPTMENLQTIIDEKLAEK